MKRYLAFCFQLYYPYGGWDDYIGDFDTIEEAKTALRKHAAEENFYQTTLQVVDTKTKKCIWDIQKKMKRIPIKAAKYIAKEYGYDQVMIYARKVGEDPDPHGEHMTTYGVDKNHCNAIGRVGSYLQREIMKWFEKEDG